MDTLIHIPPVPNCIIIVLFDRPHTRHRARFSYTCAHRSRGWQVLPDGNIIPPSVSRVVQFRVKSWNPEGDSALGKVPSFAGFQVVPAGDKFPSKAKRWPPLPSELKAINPPQPEGDTVSPLLTLNFGTGRWAYRLAVTGAEGQPPIWDDPKIHDDGSDW